MKLKIVESNVEFYLGPGMLLKPSKGDVVTVGNPKTAKALIANGQAERVTAKKSGKKKSETSE